MADITKRFFVRHVRGAPTTFVRHTVRGKVSHATVTYRLGDPRLAAGRLDFAGAALVIRSRARS
jgi:hypothetical protein